MSSISTIKIITLMLDSGWGNRTNDCADRPTGGRQTHWSRGCTR